MFCVGHELSAQVKFKLAQLVVSGFYVPHGCKYFPVGTKVLFHIPLLDGYPTGFQKSGGHALGEDLEERDGIADALDVGQDSRPCAELSPLVLGGGVFLEDFG